MYADRHVQPARFNPTSLTAAVAINAAVIAALMVANPAIVSTLPKPNLRIFTVDPVEPPPPEPQPEPLKRAAPRPTETVPLPTPQVPTRSDATWPEQPPLPPLPPATPLDGLGSGPVADALPPRPLPFVEPGIDPRHAGDLQPAYPASERRAGREGRVTIRVLVGVDGRVKQAERIGATSEAFWQATLDRALAKWRFTPATRGGVPVEAWRKLSLTFVLEN